jgi:RhtB (resistance to homoserine/threonine) family protein
MTGIDHYFTFLIAGIILNLTPGADTIYILTRSIAQGKQAGIVSVMGIATGSLIHTTFAALGLSIILASSALIFNIIKYIGAAYLLYLGIKMIFQKSKLFENKNAQVDKTDLKKIYRQGILTNVLNPKIALFYLSFLPQFINPVHTNGPIPFIILGCTFTTTGTIWCLFLAHSAAFITKTLRSNNKIAKVMQSISGGIFIGLGLQLAIKRN